MENQLNLLTVDIECIFHMQVLVISINIDYDRDFS